MTDPAASREADTLFELIRARYGGRLTAEELDGVRRGVETIVQHALALRAVRLTGADEPVPPFAPYRRDA